MQQGQSAAPFAPSRAAVSRPILPTFLRPHRLVPLLCLGLALTGCGRSEAPARPTASASTPAPAASAPAGANAMYAPLPGRQPTAAEMSALGRAMFFDPGLSASGKMACASCHSPDHAYGPPNGLSVQLGGLAGHDSGLRAVPSLRYLQTAGSFSEHHHDNDGNDSEDAGPTGGRTWDGRADSAHAQAAAPLLSPFEMANASEADVAARLRRAPYADRFRAAFGPAALDDDRQAFRLAGLALEVFQEEPKEFAPYDSKYDAVLRGQTRLSVQEARGLATFEDPNKGNCASCHISRITEDGAFPLFTDFGHIALGVPRNAALPANADPAFFDLGLCGPLRTDLKDHADYCGRFRTPSLRNVATRQVFFHNGVFHTLEDALRFYALRDTQPERVYPRDAQGRVQKFDDLPEADRGNVNTEAPFGPRPGNRPVLSDGDIRDLVAFLHTLDDGWKPPAAAAR